MKLELYFVIIGHIFSIAMNGYVMIKYRAKHWGHWMFIIGGLVIIVIILIFGDGGLI